MESLSHNRFHRTSAVFVLLLSSLSLMAQGHCGIEAIIPDTAELYSTIKIEIRICTPGYERFLDARSTNSSIIETRVPAASAPQRGMNSSYAVRFRYLVKAEKAGKMTFHGPRLICDGDTFPTLTKDIIILDDKRLDRQRKTAEAFLSERFSITENHLVLEAEDDYWCLWRDYANGAFALIDSKESLVLAYGYDKSGKRLEKTGNIPFLDYYSAFWKSATTSESSPVKISNILSTSWGQGAPYNSKCPKDRRTGAKSLLGCGAVTLGQMLHYLNVPGWKDWEIQDKKTLYKNLYRLSLELESKFSSSGTSSNIIRILHVMKNHYNTSPDAELTKAPDYCHALSIIKSNLANGSPVIGVSSSHAYIIDGMENNYIHVVMGWDGLYDGYYRIFPDKNGKCMIEHIIHNIKKR